MNWLALVGFGIFGIVWFIIANSGLIDPLFIESPEKVFWKLGVLLSQKEIWIDLGFTLYRTLSAFGIALAIGIPIGLILGHSRIFYKMFSPLVLALNAIPPVALFPLFLLFFTSSDLSKIAVGAYAAGLIVIVSTMLGIIKSDKETKLVAETFGANQFTIMKRIEFFEAMPSILSGGVLALAISLLVVTITEMFLAFTTVGLGMRIYDAYLIRRVDELYAVIVLVGALGYLLHLGMKTIEKRLVYWEDTSKTGY